MARDDNQHITKTELVRLLKELKAKGWLKNARPGNHGGIGNTLEDELGVTENNLPEADIGKWEIKSRRKPGTSLMTLFHREPGPLGSKTIPHVLVAHYGWPHKSAGTKYPETERRISLTISGHGHSNRGFGVLVNRKEKRIEINFDPTLSDSAVKDWLEKVKGITNLNPLDPVPHWTFEDIEKVLSTKLAHVVFLQAQKKKEDGEEYYLYDEIEILSRPSLEAFLRCIESGDLYVDVDARTGHNHGTKFRIKSNKLMDLFKDIERVV